MTIVFVLCVVAVYSSFFAWTRRPWQPWAVCAFASASLAAALLLFTDIATIPSDQMVAINANFDQRNY